jgi:hypothetical protein
MGYSGLARTSVMGRTTRLSALEFSMASLVSERFVAVHVMKSNVHAVNRQPHRETRACIVHCE